MQETIIETAGKIWEYLNENGEVLSSDSVVFGDVITTPSNPEREGYKFSGWNPEIPETMPANDVVVKATWTKNVYSITFVDYDETVILKEELGYTKELFKPLAICVTSFSTAE